MLFKLEIGDYSEDGYGVHEPVIYETNYDVAAIAEGYKKSCKKYGIQFNRGDNDFTGLGLKCWDKRAPLVEPQHGRELARREDVRPADAYRRRAQGRHDAILVVRRQIPRQLR